MKPLSVWGFIGQSLEAVVERLRLERLAFGVKFEGLGGKGRLKTSGGRAGG